VVTCKFFSLPNLIAGYPIMPEFVTIDDPRNSIHVMTDILHDWLTDDDARARQKATMKLLCDKVATPGATENAAKAILQRLIPADSPEQRQAA